MAARCTDCGAEIDVARDRCGACNRRFGDFPGAIVIDVPKAAGIQPPDACCCCLAPGAERSVHSVQVNHGGGLQRIETRSIALPWCADCRARRWQLVPLGIVAALIGLVSGWTGVWAWGSADFLPTLAAIFGGVLVGVGSV